MKVSVSITTYNHRAFIAQAIDSVLSQRVTFDYEIVIGDDLSTDGTREIVLEYSKSHPGIVVPVLQEQNKGDVGRINFADGLAACRGEYIAILDGDDYWINPDKMQMQVDFLDGNPDFAMCFHNAFITTPDGSRDRTYVPSYVPPVVETETLLHFCDIPAASVMVRADAVRELPDWFWTCPVPDQPFYLLASLHGKVGYLRQSMSVYRDGVGDWSWRNALERVEEGVRITETFGPYFSKHYPAEYARALARTNYRMARKLKSDPVRMAKALRASWQAEHSEFWRLLRATVSGRSTW